MRADRGSTAADPGRVPFGRVYVPGSGGAVDDVDRDRCGGVRRDIDGDQDREGDQASDRKRKNRREREMSLIKRMLLTLALCLIVLIVGVCTIML